jgi:hypothetical protein
MSQATGAEANSGTTPVRAGYGFDEAALAAWLAAHGCGSSDARRWQGLGAT